MLEVEGRKTNEKWEINANGVLNYWGVVRNIKWQKRETTHFNFISWSTILNIYFPLEGKMERCHHQLHQISPTSFHFDVILVGNEFTDEPTWTPHFTLY